MRRQSSVAVALLGLGSLSSLSFAANTVTVEAYTPGTITPAGLGTDAYKATTAPKLQDMPRDTGGGTNKYALGLSNNSFSPNTILPVGKGGGITLKFQQPVNALAGAREIGVFNANWLTSAGGFFNGDMEGALLVSNDSVTWRTLSGTTVADPLTYTSTVNDLNAPTMSYVWGTGKTAWDYCTGSGKPQSVLDTFAFADYETPMPDDSLFNNAASTNAQRALLKDSTTPADYTNLFGTTAGGNWFDISATGLSQVQYLRINVAADAPVTMRLDSVFSNAAAVVIPEPAAMAVLAAGAALALRRRVRRLAGIATVTGVAALSANAAQAQSINDVSVWAGNGNNTAVLAVTWRVPEVFNNTTMPAPIATQTLLWGYRFNGTATGADLFNAVVAADPKLYAAVNVSSFGTAVLGIGYDLDNDATFGLSDGTTTYTQTTLNAAPLNIDYGAGDQFKPTDTGDLYWGGAFGPTWDLWNEHGGNGGFTTTAPNRGPNAYFTSDGGYGGTHGQWDLAGVGLSDMTLENGSWVGFSIAAGGLEFGNDTAPGTIAYNTHKAAPATVPEPTMLVLAGLVAVGFRRKCR